MTEALEMLAALGDALGETGIAADARDLTERAREGRFFLACIGQFKRGKSTLINALLGRPVLPVGIVPVTSAITTVSYSPTLDARVQFSGGRVQSIPPGEVAAYVTEEANPGNAKGVRAVEVGAPADILRGGVCLVDTPGIGSVFGANTDVTRAFVPRIDAAIVVIGAEPPIAGDELALVSEVARETQTLLFVLNKADRSTPEERHAACAFAGRVLREALSRPADPIYEVSAARVLAGEADAQWTAFVGAIQSVVRGRDALLRRRVARRACALQSELLAVVNGREEALQRPLEDTRRRIEALRLAVGAAERSLGDLSALLSSEEGRLTAALRARKDAFLEHAGSLATERLTDALKDRDAGDVRAAAVEEARAIARRSVESWGAAMERETQELYARAMRRFAELAGDFLQSSGFGASDADASRDLDPDLRLGAPPHFYFTDMMSVAPSSPFGWVDHALPAATRRRHAVRDATTYLERLLETNASRFINDLIERVARSRAAFEADVRQVLRDVVRRAESALSAAEQAQQAGRPEVESEWARLRDLRASLSRLPIDDDSASEAVS